jgi:putative holliday junction resolvase
MNNKILSDYKNKLAGKRIAAFDFGLKRIGFAVCDEFHISITPKNVFYFEDNNLLENIKNELEKEYIGAIIIGIPIRYDNSISNIILEIESFIDKIKSITNVEIIRYDESYSSKRAVSTMVEIGRKKKDRRKKENIDRISAAIILRDFLLDIDSN